jgi:hypothetical protein
MRPNRFRLLLALCFLLALLPLAGACTREPAESSAPATPASPATAVPAAGQPAPQLGSEPTAFGAAGAPAAAPAVPLAGVRSTAMARGHIVLTGDYQADSDAEVTCATADTALQLTFVAPGKPRVLILLDDLAAKATSGTYKGPVTVMVRDVGESAFRQSGGKASAEVTVDDVATGKAVSGSFATSYTGEAGKGKVTGRFERCVFKPEPADHP